VRAGKGADSKVVGHHLECTTDSLIRALGVRRSGVEALGVEALGRWALGVEA
jgi:hypothetical protein